MTHFKSFIQKKSILKRNSYFCFNQPSHIHSVISTEISSRFFHSFSGLDYLHKYSTNKTFFQIGFSLIELLIVIAIIALLLSILIPSLSLAKRHSKAIVCGANLRRIGVGLSLYAQDNRDFYPRALPLKNGPAGYSIPSEWQTPWPSNLCPMTWQAGYPALLAPYLTDAQVSNPFDFIRLRNEMGDDNIEFFSCPDNSIDPSDTARRKCGFPLDYGLHNRVSQNRQTDPLVRSSFLAADQTWGLAYIDGSDTSGLNEASELKGWWNPFVHPNDTINVLLPSYSVERLSTKEFIRKFNTGNPPCDDPL